MNTQPIQDAIERANRDNFPGLAAGIAAFGRDFTGHSQVVPMKDIFHPSRKDELRELFRPTRVTTEIRKINSAFGEGREAIDRFADEQLRQERLREAQQ